MSEGIHFISLVSIEHTNKDKYYRYLESKMNKAAEAQWLYLEKKFDNESDETSWLGGLPKLPENVDWPNKYEKDHPAFSEGYLHHVAQLSCKDFPDELWDGCGPRTGWLAFFLDLNDDDGTRHCKVIHTEELGPERKPPAQPKLIYLSSFESSLKDKDGIRSRWPLTLSWMPPPTPAGNSEKAEPHIVASSQSKTESDVEEAEYAPFDWQTAIEYVDKIYDGIKRSYAKDGTLHIDPVYQSGTGLQGFMKRFESVKEIRRINNLLKLQIDAMETGNWSKFPASPPSKTVFSQDEIAAKKKLLRQRTKGVVEELRILCNRLPPQKRRLQKLIKKYRPIRDELISKLNDYPEKIRRLSSQDEPFERSWPEFLREFLEIKFPMTEFGKNDIPIIKFKSITDGRWLEEYRQFVFHYVTDLHCRKDRRLSFVPNPLLEDLKNRWKRDENTFFNHIGGEPFWLQYDSFGLFDGGFRDQMKELGAISDHGLWQSDFDQKNHLLLQVANDLTNIETGLHFYFVIPDGALKKNDFSKVFAICQSG